MRTKDKNSKTKTPGGVLLSKIAVEEEKDRSCWIRAVNLTSNSLKLFKKTKNWYYFGIEDMSKPFLLAQGLSAVSNVITGTLHHLI